MVKLSILVIVKKLSRISNENMGLQTEKGHLSRNDNFLISVSFFVSSFSLEKFNLLQYHLIAFTQFNNFLRLAFL